MQSRIARRADFDRPRYSRMQPRPRILCQLIRASLPLALLALGGTLRGQMTEDFEKAPIRYSATKPHDRVTQLQAKIASGTLKLEGSAKAVVRALLHELDVPVASQIVVFSKTSLQRSRISPDHPRALFFSDTCYVGWVPGGLAELTVIDPQLGPIFYAFSPRRAVSAEGPNFERDADCLRCHGGAFVREIPAVFVRSVFTGRDGEPLLRHGSVVVDYRTPFDQRWGGWYVTGRHGTAVHRGNSTAEENGDTLVFDPQAGANVTSLDRYFDTSSYLAPTSDIVALLVYEHQTAVQNALTHAAFAARRMLDYQRGLQRAFKEPETDEPAYDSVKSVFAGATRELVDALLYKDEAPLPVGVAGDPAFTTAFAAGAIRTRSGDSLKDLGLKGQVFRNRCSYLIYSEAMLALPAALKRQIYPALARALAPTNPDPRYAHLDGDERARIRAILLETHPDFARYAVGH